MHRFINVNHLTSKEEKAINEESAIAYNWLDPDCMAQRPAAIRVTLSVLTPLTDVGDGWSFCISERLDLQGLKDCSQVDGSTRGLLVDG